MGTYACLAFALPRYFAYRKLIPHGYKTPLFILLLLGSMQGVIGWWMVKSGLVSDPLSLNIA